VATAPTFAVLAPLPAGVAVQPEYQFLWDMTGGSNVQQNYRVVVYAEDQVTVVHDTGVVVSATESYTIPSGILKTAKTYYVRIFGQDTLSQSAQSGLIQFTTAWTPPAIVTGVRVQAIGSQNDV